jgi:type I restriction enzyme R subunit
MPRILIVTEKLLTGFDAPILYCMYLDKPMRDHVLLQAIARVNRPYEDTEGRAKTAGFVLDFVGIFDKLERALAFDSEDVAGVIEGLDVLQGRFEVLMAAGRSEYLTLWAGRVGDKAVEAVLEHFRDRERRHEFYRFFRELQELYDILSPDAFLRPFLRDYEELTRLYRVVRAAFEPGVSVDKSFLRKTAELVARQTGTTALEDPRLVAKLEAATLERIAGEQRPDTVKVFNLIKSLYLLVAQEGSAQPHLYPIGERAEAIAKAFEERQITTQEALAQLEALVREYRDAEESRRERDLSAAGFAVFWLLQRDGVAEAEPAARAVAAALDRYPYWQRGGQQERDARREMYKALLAAGVKDVVTVTTNLLNVLRKAGRA